MNPNRRLGTAAFEALIRKVAEWLVNEADRDEAVGVIQTVAGVTIYDGENEKAVKVFDNADGDYCGMFNDIIEFNSIAMCDKCGHKESEKAFQVIEKGFWYGDLKCPKCGSVAVTVADATI